MPTLYDNCITISISDLKRWDYLKPNQYKSGVITWSRNGNKIGSISIAINTHSENSYLELDYKCNETPINYRVRLVSMPSNIGKGVVWFFVCPHTYKRCRKLHSIGNYFYHRSAFRGCMYEKQTHSHKSRNSTKYLEMFLKGDKACEIMHTKYFKTFYSGKPTKRYIRLMDKVKLSSQFSIEKYKSLFFK
jgi:hypothetical protein